MSVIIISAIILILITSASLTGFYGRSNVYDAELKARSSALAEACVDIAMLGLANDVNNYAGNATTSVGNGKCYVGPVTPVGVAPQKQFKTRAYIPEVQGAYTVLSISIKTSDFSVVSWQEIPTYY